MRKIISNIPNGITLLNLLCGFVGIVCAFKYPEIPTAYFVWVGFLFDVLDGLAARILRAQSKLGGELDSLSDIVTFGVLPSIVLYQMLVPLTSSGIIPFLAGSIAVFSAYRLAKFNIDENQTNSFIGLPTPANALFITGLPLITSGAVNEFLHESWAVLLIVGIFSYLLVCSRNFFSYKMKNYTWADNKFKYTFLLSSILFILFFNVSAISYVMLFYVFSSLITKKNSHA